MGQSSVAQFATELGLPAELLLEQLKGAGVSKTAYEDTLTEQDKTALLEYLRKEHGAQEPKNKITLTRKQVTEIKKSDSSGKARTIQVEVRKKRVLVRRDPVAEAEAGEEAAMEAATLDEAIVAEATPVVEAMPEPAVEVVPEPEEPAVQAVPAPEPVVEAAPEPVEAVVAPAEKPVEAARPS